VKTQVVEKGRWERELAVEVEAERIEAEVAKACRDYQRRAEIPGFRRGKVPLRLIQARYGEAIREQVIRDLLPDLVREATTAAGLVAVTPPTIADISAEPGAGLKFTARVDVWPEVDVQNYEGLPVTRATHRVTSEEVEQRLQELRERHATEQVVTRPLEKGDVLIADLQRLDASDLPIVGARYTERRILVGQPDAPSLEFDERVLGMRAGETRNVRFAYRQDLDNERLAGTQEHLLVTAREIHARQLPALDDEFAKDVGEQFQTLDELRAHVRRELEQRWQFLLEERFRAELLGRLVMANPFDVPAGLVDAYVRLLRRRVRGEDRRPAEPEPEPTDEERKHAERRLRQALLIEALRKKLGIEVADAELDAYVERWAAEHGTTAQNLRSAGRVEQLRHELEEEKVFAALSAAARITEETI